MSKPIHVAGRKSCHLSSAREAQVQECAEIKMLASTATRPQLKIASLQGASTVSGLARNSGFSDLWQLSVGPSGRSAPSEATGPRWSRSFKHSWERMPELPCLPPQTDRQTDRQTNSETSSTHVVARDWATERVIWAENDAHQPMWHCHSVRPPCRSLQSAMLVALVVVSYVKGEAADHTKSSAMWAIPIQSD